MTEAEWLTATDPQPMLESLRGEASDRTFLQFMVACAHRLRPEYTTEQIKRLVEAVESYTEGNKTRQELRAAFPYLTGVNIAPHAMKYCQRCLMPTERELEVKAQAILVRDIFGNPFRPVSVTPDWRTSSVLALAEGIYADRAFDRMPVLADALEDAGCDHADILNHCRVDVPHVRGCWVVDLLLGKE